MFLQSFWKVITHTLTENIYSHFERSPETASSYNPVKQLQMSSPSEKEKISSAHTAAFLLDNETTSRLQAKL